MDAATYYLAMLGLLVVLLAGGIVLTNYIERRRLRRPEGDF